MVINSFSFHFAPFFIFSISFFQPYSFFVRGDLHVAKCCNLLLLQHIVSKYSINCSRECFFASLTLWPFLACAFWMYISFVAC
ncbi:unnamed protein product [Ilex paraguariensis]|uniref:Uncharacterized protein n=1 Tax=Ilex paraguariensis TaxID=185542 RepID=A0ABC8RAY4_9AQUA